MLSKHPRILKKKCGKVIAKNRYFLLTSANNKKCHEVAEFLVSEVFSYNQRRGLEKKHLATLMKSHEGAKLLVSEVKILRLEHVS